MSAPYLQHILTSSLKYEFQNVRPKFLDDTQNQLNQQKKNEGTTSNPYVGTRYTCTYMDQI